MVITLTGENDFMRSTELAKFVTDFIGKYGEMGLEQLDIEEAVFQKIYDALTSLPFLATKKLVILKSPSSNKEFSEKAEQLITNLPETTDVIFVERKFDKRSSLYKLLKKRTDFREFQDLGAASLIDWLSEQAKIAGGSIQPGDARFLVERVGVSQLLLSNELAKLLAYNPKISRETITLLSEPTPQSTIFELLDALFSGNNKKALMLYAEQRALKVEPQQIIAMLVWQFHVLVLLKSAGARRPDQIAKEARMNPFVVQKSLVVAKHLSMTRLKELVDELFILDTRLKSEDIDDDEALQYFFLSVSGEA